MKKLKTILISFVCTFLFIAGVDASNSISVSAPSLAVVGSTFEVVVTVSSTDPLGAWNFGVTYDSEYVAYQSGRALSIADVGNGSKKVETYKYVFKALKAGTANIRVQDASMVDWDNKFHDQNPPIKNSTLTIKTQSQIQASYSKDNNLKSLSVEGYEISPAFDKNTLEYTVSVPDTVEKINVKAVANDAKARIKGTGTINISEGANKIEVIVTAENGSVKTYTLNIDVRDLNPITAKVDGKDYTVVKKEELLTELIGFSKTTVKIGDIDIPAFKNDRAGLLAVGLKDSDGTIEMFLYDEEKETYSVFKEIRNPSLNLLPVEIESVPEGFTKEKLKINGIECDVMKSDDLSDFYIIYAMNLENGEKGYYQYDEETKGFIKYDSQIFDIVKEQKEEYVLYIFLTAGIAGAFLLLVIVLGARISKLKKLLRKVAKPKTEEHVSSSQSSSEEKVSSHDEEIETEDDDDFLELKKKKKKKRK